MLLNTRIGYEASHTNKRYILSQRPVLSASNHVVDLRNVPFIQLEEFDRKYFPAPVKHF